MILQDNRLCSTVANTGDVRFKDATNQAQAPGNIVSSAGDCENGGHSKSNYSTTEKEQTGLQNGENKVARPPAKSIGQQDARSVEIFICSPSNVNTSFFLVFFF